MNRFFILLLICFTFSDLSAQDILMLHNGERIQCKVIEIFPEEISYKKVTNLQGPNYRIEKTQVASIVFENGDVLKMTSPAPAPAPEPVPVVEETYPAVETVRGIEPGKIRRHRYKFYMNNERLSIAEVRLLMRSNPQALHYFEQGDAMRKLDKTMDIMGATFFFGGITVALIAGEPALLSICGGWLICGIVARIAHSPAVDNFDIAIAKYNDRFSYNTNNPGFDLKFGLTSNGIGLKANF